jgi:hypothetical protein
MLLAHIRGCESLLKSGVRADLLTAAAEQLLVLVAARR